jgi:glutamate 5-kinase
MMNNSEISMKDKRRIVFKIGTSTLTHPNGLLNLQRIEKLATVLTDLRNRGKEVLLVTSGAIGVGASKIGLERRPENLAEKQALAAIGQAQLMKIYQRFFNTYNQVVAQILITKDNVTVPDRRENAQNTLNELLRMGIIPIINENDTVATDEIEFGDNDSLSAYVAELISADLLVLLTDIDGLYTADPRKDADAVLIPLVTDISEEIESIATGAGSRFGTGGMSTKITAAKICMEAHIDTLIINGDDPYSIYKIVDGEAIGTLFKA